MSALKSTPQSAPQDVAFRLSPEPVPYPEAVAAMEERVAAIHAGTAPELLWFVEHPPLYTAGTSAKASDLIDANRLPVFETGRGGQYTYHGPGQRVAYVLLDLKRRGQDVRGYVCDLESWLIDALKTLGVTGERRDGRVGLWVSRNGPLGGEDKIAALGVRVRRWITYHGIALNVHPDLGHYAGIVPCGVREHGVTSLAALGKTTDMAIVDAALKDAFQRVFAANLKDEA